MRYYNKITGTEAIPDVHSIDPPDVIPLADDNPYWAPLPPGQQLTYDADGIPDGLEDIPPYIPTPEEEVMAALIAEGVNNQALTSAHYLDRMGYPDQAEAMDEAITRVAGDFPHYPSPEANLPERMAAILALI